MDSSSYSAARAADANGHPCQLPIPIPIPSHPRPHNNAHMTMTCQTQCQEFQRHCHNAASAVANLQQQKQQLLNQRQNLLAKNAEQKVKNEELLNQKINFAKQISDIKQRSKQLNDCKTETDKAFSRSKTFMILQLEKVTAENEQAVIEESNRHEELKIINEKLFSQLAKLTAENTRLALEASIINEELLVKNEEILLRSGKLAKQISHTIAQLKLKKEQVSEQLNELARYASAAGQSHKRGAHALQDSNHADIDMDYTDECCDIMDEYTNCCVCLEPYEVNPASSSVNRLPIKSATCAHTLCEDCVDNCYASLLTSRGSKVRYVTCPQCRTKRAFDVQNKVVDFFLREYIMSRGNADSNRRVKSKLIAKTLAEGTDEDRSSNGDDVDSSTVTSRREENAIVTVNDSQANFQLMFEGAVEKHKTCTMELITRSVEKRVKSVSLSVIEEARRATRYMMQRANTFILKHGGKPYSNEEIAAALSKAEKDAVQMYKEQKNAILLWYRQERGGSAAMQNTEDKVRNVDAAAAVKQTIGADRKGKKVCESETKDKVAPEKAGAGVTDDVSAKSVVGDSSLVGKNIASTTAAAAMSISDQYQYEILI
jgi:hypothetical protein